MVVSKNPGGSKRVTSLADALKLNFGIVTTERRRTPLSGSMILESGYIENMSELPSRCGPSAEVDGEVQAGSPLEAEDSLPQRRSSQRTRAQANGAPTAASPAHRPTNSHVGSSPLFRSSRIDSQSPPASRAPIQRNTETSSLANGAGTESDSADEYTDERAREVITGRLVQGHIVDDDYPSPILSTMSSSVATLPGDALGQSQYDDRDPMASSFYSNASGNQADQIGSILMLQLRRMRMKDSRTRSLSIPSR